MDTSNWVFTSGDRFFLKDADRRFWIMPDQEPKSCPYCGGVKFQHIKERIRVNSEEFMDATHLCLNERCGRKFGYTPPTREVA